ncbi:TIGR04222 domain-containing membrane protein [Streptomyces sp. NPDC051310]|uniref:TIGR04222 domain-containing membrane protein n=1 Tax=Streptomyces sp. NPDC051310 TaxID=3365649 RepID=UPI0037B3F48B
MNVLAVLIDLGVVVSSVVLICGVAASRRRGPGGSVRDRTEAAFLNGGPGLVVDTAITALHADGRLVVAGPGIVGVPRPVAYDAVERAVIAEHAAAPSGSLHGLRLAVMRHPAVQEVGDGLAARGLITPAGAGRRWRRWGVAQGIVCLLLLFASVPLTVVEMTRYGAADWPFPFIGKVGPVLVAGGVVALVCASSAGARLTRAGRDALAAYRWHHTRPDDPAELVAVCGLRALPDRDLWEQLTTAARRNRGGTPVSAGAAPVVWCAGVDPGGSGSGCGGGSSCGGGGGAGCGGGGGSCGSSGGGSSCASSSGSSCGSSSSSSCGGGSSCGSSSS